MSRTAPELNHRERAVLTAAEAGRVEMTCSCEPDLYIDGVCFCDQPTGHALVHRGLLRRELDGRPGERAPAALTSAGHLALRDDLARTVL
ncbi:hypothetical protein [Saccharopolyspora griseoalba]|uniref:ArsR family transcriptional regulator n=1 Tax=Saccharopolyspora griseoalba TaxID=1431848 RepID=A0ABW2LHR7_9PSEU